MPDLLPFTLPTDPAMRTATSIAILLAVVLAIHFIGRALLLHGVIAVIRRSRMDWDDLLIDHKVVQRASLLIPLVAARLGLPALAGVPPDAEAIVERVLAALMVLVIARTAHAVLNAGHALYLRSEAATTRPIKSYIQLGTVVAYLVAVIFIVASLAGVSPWYLVSGLGAMMAVILLIFRDTLLSLVASIQIGNNDLLRVGDWIEMPEFGADGDVVDIALHTVRIQNWDKTITVVPTHKFLDHSFRNWRGMYETGGRRIKRAIAINAATVRFLANDEVEAFRRFRLLGPYLDRKGEELAADRAALAAGLDVSVNARRLTNLGTLRAYILAYLQQHREVRQDLTMLVRQLEPTPEGIPIEVYCFTADIAWDAYERIQADIFDHLLAMVPEFDLRVYQRPSGHDLAAVAEG